MAAKCIEANTGVFALAISVAPVTDWRFYDTMYTERYMKTPALNPKGYDKSAVVKMDGFKRSKFLLIHGTGDDNVHFQNTADLVHRLTANGVEDYQVQFYTDSDHSMNSSNARTEIYLLIQRYLCTAFKMSC